MKKAAPLSCFMICAAICTHVLAYSTLLTIVNGIESGSDIAYAIKFFQ